ncbi:hypothetical protein OH492_08485 [Vibrio chagasii]|nr:hypothetical protein [Vibrio chagasii]
MQKFKKQRVIRKELDQPNRCEKSAALKTATWSYFQRLAKYTDSSESDTLDSSSCRARRRCMVRTRWSEDYHAGSINVLTTSA